SGWYPDRKLRLWNRNKGQWGGTDPHDKVIMESGCTMAQLKGDLLHYTTDSVAEFREQQHRFATIAAKEMFLQRRKISSSVIFLKSAFTFIRNYFLLLGFLDGKSGWQIASIASNYTFTKYSLLKKMNGGDMSCCD
ncbi:MAG: hypothetical protein ACHQD9_08250, partial [Chitinophagales bacterium]